MLLMVTAPVVEDPQDLPLFRRVNGEQRVHDLIEHDVARGAGRGPVERHGRFMEPVIIAPEVAAGLSQDAFQPGQMLGCDAAGRQAGQWRFDQQPCVEKLEQLAAPQLADVRIGQHHPAEAGSDVDARTMPDLDRAGGLQAA